MYNVSGHRIHGSVCTGTGLSMDNILSTKRKNRMKRVVDALGAKEQLRNNVQISCAGSQIEMVLGTVIFCFFGGLTFLVAIAANIICNIFLSPSGESSNI